MGFLLAQMVKSLPAMWETWVWSLGWEDPLKKGTATHCSILAWRIPWTEEPGGLWSVELQRVGHDWATNTHIERRARDIGLRVSGLIVGVIQESRMRKQREKEKNKQREKPIKIISWSDWPHWATGIQFALGTLCRIMQNALQNCPSEEQEAGLSTDSCAP